MSNGNEPGNRRFAYRLALEGLVIVASILLAFALDAAWEGRQERLLRNEYLRVLEDEFVSAADEMQEQIEYHERQLVAIETMLENLEQGQKFKANDFRRLRGLFYFGPAHPVFNDLANTSSVDILGFSSLRLALFRYGREKEFLQNRHARETAFWQNEMSPYLNQTFDYSVYLDESPDNVTVSRIISDESADHDDRYLKNLLIVRRGMVRGQLRMDREIASIIGEILADIRSSRPDG